MISEASLDSAFAAKATPAGLPTWRSKDSMSTALFMRETFMVVAMTPKVTSTLLMRMSLSAETVAPSVKMG